MPLRRSARAAAAAATEDAAQIADTIDTITETSSTSAKSKPQKATATRKAPVSQVKRGAKAAVIEDPASDKPDAEPAPTKTTSGVEPNVGKKRKRAPPQKARASVNVLPHGLGIKSNNPTAVAEQSTHDNEQDIQVSPVAGNAVSKTEQNTAVPSLAAGTNHEPDEKPKRGKKAANKKTNKYGVVLGVTPYPDLIHPTPEEAEQVHRLLTKKHGEVKAPEDIPVPSRTVAGCGEVKFTLEALLRTMISAHTSMENAGYAIEGLIKRYGTFDSGLTPGCVDWDRVRREGREELEQAIKRGGMQKNKSTDIHATLEMVYAENQARRAELLVKDGEMSKAKAENVKEKAEEVVKELAEPDKDALPDDAQALALDITLDRLAKDRKAGIMVDLANQILRSNERLLTLDYLHALSPEGVFQHLLQYRGVGVKTAACTLLFCMQRPLFAVDTHVFRLCKWLGWAPENANRDATFAHCDVRVPDQYKYALHQLMIVHGKDCARCRANTSMKSDEWEQADCPLEGLLKRTGVRKGGVDPPKPKKRKKVVDDHEESAGEDDGDEVLPKKGRGKTKKTKQDDEDEDKPSPPKKAKRSTAKARLTKKEYEDDDEVGDEDQPSPSKKLKRAAKTTAKGKKPAADGDANAAADTKPAPRPRRTVAKKPKREDSPPADDAEEEEHPHTNDEANEEGDTPKTKPTRTKPTTAAKSKAKAKPDPKAKAAAKSKEKIPKGASSFTKRVTNPSADSAAADEEKPATIAYPAHGEPHVDPQVGGEQAADDNGRGGGDQDESELSALSDVDVEDGEGAAAESSATDAE